MNQETNTPDPRVYTIETQSSLDLSNAFKNAVIPKKTVSKEIMKKQVTKANSTLENAVVEKMINLSKSTSNKLSDIVDQNNLKKINSALNGGRHRKSLIAGFVNRNKHLLIDDDSQDELDLFGVTNSGL